jgi:hypothetical protein
MLSLPFSAWVCFRDTMPRGQACKCRVILLFCRTPRDPVDVLEAS